ncbi:MAG: ATP-binding cassette domain-containing protein [Actinobacteria bacterium]|nr:ATP-binding cassette domain-containing protein [Cyanobacteriota bacterium]MCL5771224.1 ATP-binding cassette domain-containing protein [Actinomycetota bacterium]
MDILKIENLTLSFNGKNILSNLNLKITEGIIHAIIGPNGAGKSTLASTIMGLEGFRNFEGEIYFKNQPLKGLGVYERARLGITLGWQEPARYEGLKVSQFIKASSKNKDKDSIIEAFNIVGIDYYEYHSRAVDKSLSGGERKKIELASIVAMQPSLVILDEPDSGIDIASLKNIFAAIKYLHEKDATIILITHSLEVLKQAEFAYLLCNGTILDEGKVSKIRKYFEGKCMPCPHKNIPLLSEIGKGV